MSKDNYSKSQTFEINDIARIFILTDMPVKGECKGQACIRLLTDGYIPDDLFITEEGAEVLHDMLADWLSYRRNKND